MADRLPVHRALSYSAFFEDAWDQLAVLADISCELSLSAVPSQLGEDIARILRDQRTLQHKYNEKLSLVDSLKALPNKSLYKDCQLQISDISNELSQITLSLAKSLKSHPSIASNLLKIQTEQNTLQTLFSKCIRELKDLKFDSLASAVDEEYKKRNTLLSTIHRENEASESLKQLTSQLAQEKLLLEQESHDRDLIIQQLKDTIQEINHLTVSEQKYLKKETKARESSFHKVCLNKEQALLEEIQVWKLKLKVENDVHAKSVEFLARQRDGLEVQIQEWMERYEVDTEQKTLELEALKSKRTADLDRFEELVAAYEELEKVVEEDRLQKLKEAEELKAQQRRDQASMRLQRWWRRILEKKKEKNVKSSKKGGKKGSKSASKTPKSSKSKKK
ncbi:hypothetical protein HK098_006036 [Nowakowskiella sp. JEL0407]|nr:hypothetical protein HK098_006036 [Nowakowskiella sp. JEL0407]